MKVSRQAAAAEQIDQAIRSLFKNLIVSSVTLAGAAETLLVDNGKSGGVLFSSMKKQGEKRTGIPQSQRANEHFNKLRNWLKHYDKTMPEIDAQRDDGVIMILRAYTEFTSAFGEDATTPTMKEFESWFRENALFNLNG